MKFSQGNAAYSVLRTAILGQDTAKKSILTFTPILSPFPPSFFFPPSSFLLFQLSPIYRHQVLSSAGCGWDLLVANRLRKPPFYDREMGMMTRLTNHPFPLFPPLLLLFFLRTRKVPYVYRRDVRAVEMESEARRMQVVAAR